MLRCARSLLLVLFLAGCSLLSDDPEFVVGDLLEAEPVRGHLRLTNVSDVPVLYAVVPESILPLYDPTPPTEDPDAYPVLAPGEVVTVSREDVRPEDDTVVVFGYWVVRQGDGYALRASDELRVGW